MKHILLVIIPILTTLLTPMALAEPSGADKALADSLFRDGRKMMEAGKLEEACGMFAESHRLDPQLGTLINLALCHKERGQTASAWAEFNEAAAEAKRLGDGKRETFAREHAEALQPVLSYLVVTVPAPAPDTLAISLDGEPLAAAAWGKKLPIDPGEHEISATANGKRPWTAKLTIPEGPAEIPIEIGPFEDEPVPPPPAPPPPPPISVPLPAPPAPDDGVSALLISGAVIGGVGLAGIVVGAVFGARTLSTESKADERCPGRVCPDQESLDLHDDAATYATVSTIAFIAGGVLAAGGITMVAISLADPSDPDDHAGPSLVLSARGVSFVWGF